MRRTALVLFAFLVAGGCSIHVGCSTRVDDTGTGSGSAGSASSPEPARPKEHMVTIAAGTYVASDPVFAPDGDGKCSTETMAKVEHLSKVAPWPDRPQAVTAFTIDETPTSCADYRACMGSGACPPVDTRGKCRSYPALGVTIDQAIAYCTWRHARLPTLLQWQAAVRGPTGKPFGRCDDESSTTCKSTSESGVVVFLDAPSEFTSTSACGSSHDGPALRFMLATSFGHALAGFSTWGRGPEEDPLDSLFRCVHDEIPTP